MACVNLPIVLSSAVSSNIFILSKNLSTSAAVSESAPRSTSSAPKDTIPSGILITPDTRPAPKALYQLVSLFFSEEIRLSKNRFYFIYTFKHWFICKPCIFW